jgi:hypothetical protein
MLVLIVASGVNRVYWHRGYSVVEDAVVFGIMTLIAIALAGAGRWLTARPR